ncbi:hypothetical protein RchiOBHm_Chr2g0109451 [Rosa chinensis]|uniref:Uncharacterized protein n=1 Tax=Rosa chinensis TaxID=74649 RepID=A0A2P6RPI5_ROSCH|nr:hypothetical protein RchiOBHm_Chr2g0109451 [Rosa chinensis]
MLEARLMQVGMVAVLGKETLIFSAGNHKFKLWLTGLRGSEPVEAAEPIYVIEKTAGPIYAIGLYYEGWNQANALGVRKICEDDQVEHGKHFFLAPVPLQETFEVGLVRFPVNTVGKVPQKTCRPCGHRNKPK